MADDQKSTYGEVPDLMQEFIAQLRGAAERLEGLTGLGGSVPSSALPSLPPWLAPGADSRAVRGVDQDVGRAGAAADERASRAGG